MTENRNALTAETQDNQKAVRATVPLTYIGIKTRISKIIRVKMT